MLNSTSTISNNVKESLVYRGIAQVDYTTKLNINEPSLNSIPIFRVLNNTGEIINNCNSIIVSTN